MADKVIVYSNGSLSLADFQITIQQNEGIIGPLFALEKEGEKNAITLEDGQAPENRAILEIYDGANPPDKDGHDKVCHGLCLVEGKEKKVAAYRKT